MSEVDQALADKESEMTTVAATANERIQRAQLQAQPTAVVEPPEIPEPMPVPSDPPQPVTVPAAEPRALGAAGARALAGSDPGALAPAAGAATAVRLAPTGEGRPALPRKSIGCDEGFSSSSSSRR